MPTSTPTGMTKLTVSEFFLPNGASPQPNGISPDILLPSVSFQTKRPVIETRTSSEATLPKLSVSDPAWAARRATLRQLNEQRMIELAELQHLQRWSTALKRNPAAPSGDATQVRQWLDQRRDEKVAFKKERRELEPLSRFTQVGQFGSRQYSNSESVALDPDRIYDVELQEALRVLSDSMEMEALANPAPM